jgi:hypothetical protein
VAGKETGNIHFLFWVTIPAKNGIKRQDRIAIQVKLTTGRCEVTPLSKGLFFLLTADR